MSWNLRRVGVVSTVLTTLCMSLMVPPGMANAASLPSGNVDSASVDLGSASGPAVRVVGWAYDPDSTSKSSFVDVYDQRPDGTLTGVRVSANASRNDVAAAFPGVGPGHGFTAVVGLTVAGTHTLCSYAIDNENPSTNTALGCRTVTLPGPIGSVDVTRMIVPGRLSVEGWATQPGAPDLDTEVHVYVTAPDGSVAAYGGVMTETLRPDVTAVFGWSNGRTGFGTEIPISQTGRHTVCVYGIGSTRSTNDIAVPSVVSVFGCNAVDVRNSFGSLDELSWSAGSLRVRGWALNPNATTVPTEVHVYDFGPTATVARSGLFTSTARPDVVAAFPGLGNQPGFDFSLPSSGAGRHTVCAYGITAGGGTGNVSLGCRDVTVG